MAVVQLSTAIRNAELMAPLGIAIARADIPSLTIPVRSFVVDGYSTVGDGGAGATYVAGTSLGAKAIQDASGAWFELSIQGVVRAEWFGAKGDGTTDDVAALNAAFGILQGAGGGVLRLRQGKTYRVVAANLATGYKTVLEGDGHAQIYNQSGLSGFIKGSAVIALSSLRTITLQVGSTLRNVMVIRDGLAITPTTSGEAATAVAQWAGESSIGINALTDTIIRDVMVVGFNLGAKFSGARPRVRSLHIDCVNGWELTSNGDTAIIEDVICTPYWTSNLGGGAISYRPGVAAYLHDRADGAKVYKCGSYGWRVGFRLSNIWATNFDGCYYDNSTANSAEDLVGVETLNCVSYCDFNGFLMGATKTGWRLNHCDAAHAAVQPGAGQPTNGHVSIRGGQSSVMPSIGGVHIDCGPYSTGAISDVTFNTQGAKILNIQANAGRWHMSSWTMVGAPADPWFTIATSGANYPSFVNIQDQSTTAGGSVINGVGNSTSGGNGSSGFFATISGGRSNTAEGAYSWIPGGFAANSRGQIGKGVWASNGFAAVGDAQCGEAILRAQTTGATVTRMTADTTAPGSFNTATLPNGGMFRVTFLIGAKQVGQVDAASWKVEATFLRGANAAATTLVGGGGASIAPDHNTTNASAWRVTVAADTTQGAIALSATGEAAKTINWVARVLSVEVAG